MMTLICVDPKRIKDIRPDVAERIHGAPQFFDITTSTAFANLADSPPRGRYLDIVGRFVVLGALTTSLDNFSTSSIAEISAFDPSHTLNFFRGASLGATLDTAEQGTDGTRIKVKGFRVTNGHSG